MSANITPSVKQQNSGYVLIYWAPPKNSDVVQAFNVYKGNNSGCCAPFIEPHNLHLTLSSMSARGRPDVSIDAVVQAVTNVFTFTPQVTFGNLALYGGRPKKKSLGVSCYTPSSSTSYDGTPETIDILISQLNCQLKEQGFNERYLLTTPVRENWKTKGVPTGPHMTLGTHKQTKGGIRGEKDFIGISDILDEVCIVQGHHRDLSQPDVKVTPFGVTYFDHSDAIEDVAEKQHRRKSSRHERVLSQTPD